MPSLTFTLTVELHSRSDDGHMVYAGMAESITANQCNTVLSLMKHF